VRLFIYSINNIIDIFYLHNYIKAPITNVRRQVFVKAVVHLRTSKHMGRPHTPQLIDLETTWKLSYPFLVTQIYTGLL